jgi:hypothetical protein
MLCYSRKQVADIMVKLCKDRLVHMQNINHIDKKYFDIGDSGRL